MDVSSEEAARCTAGGYASSRRRAELGRKVFRREVFRFAV